MGDSDWLVSLLFPSLTSPIRVPHRPRWWRPGGWDKYGGQGFEEGLAPTGHRGRVDARGQPPGRSPGLTRTTGRPAVAPSRDGRWRVAFGERAWAKHSREEAGPRLPGTELSATTAVARRRPPWHEISQRSAAGDAPSSVTRRSAGTAIRRSRQARGPVSSLAAGIDAASMARQCQGPLQKR